MLLSTLTEELVAHLNSSPESWAGSMSVSAESQLDPSMCLKLGLGVYMVPAFVQYNTDAPGVRPRTAVHTTNRTLFVALIVSKVFEALPTEVGVTNWEEAKVIVDIRERAEMFIMKYGSHELTLASVDPTPIEEIELDNRNFVSITTFGYQEAACVSQYESSSLLTGSRGESKRQKTLDSMRSRLSLGLKPDNQ